MIVLPLPLLLAACAWRGPVPARTVGDLEPTWQVTCSTETAAERVAVRSIREERTVDGRLAVSLDLENLSGADLPLQVRTAFHTESDPSGGSPATDAVWLLVVLPGQGSVPYRAEALRPGDAAWQVEIRTP